MHLSGLVSQMSGDNVTGYRKLGLEVGGGMLFPLKPAGHKIGLALNYIQKGARDGRNELQGDFSDYSLNLDYLELPLSYWVPLWGVYFQGGISAAYRVRFKQLNNGIEAAAPSNLSTFEFGLHAGFHFQMNEKFIMNFKVHHSLTPVQESVSPVSFWFSQGGMHSIISLGITYQLTEGNFVWKSKSSKGTE